MPSRRTASPRLVDILFIIAFATQGAVWARELILGVIGHRVGAETGETALGNAMAVIRVLVSIALFAIAVIVILDNLGAGPGSPPTAAGSRGCYGNNGRRTGILTTPHSIARPPRMITPITSTS